MKRTTLLLLTILTGSAVPAMAVPAFTFGSPDAPLPATPGDGLNGAIWNDPAIAPVDSLADARDYIAANDVDAYFCATVVDYPNGAGATGTDTTIAGALGVDAASLSDPAVGDRAVLNSIIQLDGYIAITNPGSLFIGVGSDDGSDLSIQGTQVINNDGLHPFPGGGAGPVEIAFTEPGLYAVDILFFESQVVEWGLELFLDAPANGTPVPQSMLYKSTGQVPEVSATVGLFGLSLLTLVGYASRQRRGGPTA